MATKYSLEAKFVANGSKLKVYAHEGKRGINIGVTIKNPGMRAVTGCPACVQDQDVAAARFYELVNDAISLGWTPKSTTSGVATRRTSFSLVPAAPGFVPPAPEVIAEIGGDPVDQDGFVNEDVSSDLTPPAAPDPAAIVNDKPKSRRRQ